MTKVDGRLRTRNRTKTAQDSESLESSKDASKEKETANSCSHCDKTFSNKVSLQRHARVHADGKQYNCTRCDAEFTQPARLKKHCEDTHGPLFECEHCDRWYLSKEQLAIHVGVHSVEGPFACPKCPQTFLRSGTLKVHLKTHSKARPFACNICKAAYKIHAHLTTHMKRHAGQRDYACGLCNKKFIRGDNLRTHLECFHYGEKTVKCTVCNKSFKGHLQAHMRTHFMEKPHKCPECGARFTQKSQLNVHLRKHTGYKPYICPMCDVGFVNSTVLKSHLRVHTGEKPFKCLLCKSAFVQLPHLKKHMKCVHGKEPFVCLPCWVFYKTKRQLDAHFAEGKCKPPVEETTAPETASSTISKIPQIRDAKASSDNVEKAPPVTRCEDMRNILDGFLYGGKTFDCTYCKASFDRPLALDAHMRTHVVKKPFKCGQCEMCFALKAQLTRHIKKHTKPHICQTCDARFAYKDSLNKHYRVHTGERPYKCCLCSSAFSRDTHLKTHMRCIHDKDKPFGCKPCYVFYATKGELEAHLAEGECKPDAEGKVPQSEAEDTSTELIKDEPEEEDENSVDDLRASGGYGHLEESVDDPEELKEDGQLASNHEYSLEDEDTVGNPEGDETSLGDSDGFEGLEMPLDVILRS